MSGYAAPVVSPYDASVPNLEAETPELADVLNYVVAASMQEINVCMPAQVHAVSGNQTVDLLLLPQTLYASDTAPVDKPIVSNVPVCCPMGADWSIKVPIAVGDLGLALFADRNLDAYLAGDGSATHDPADTRMHTLADAIFLPGLPTTSGQTQDKTDDMVLTNGKAQIKLLKSGKVQIRNDQQELMDLVNQLIEQVSTLAQDLQTAQTLVTNFGIAQFNVATIDGFVSVQNSVDQIQQNLATLYQSGSG